MILFFLKVGILFYFILFYFICSEFCHTLEWNSHGFTCVPHPDTPSHLPLHPLPLGLPSAPGPSACLMHPTWAGDLFHPRYCTCFDAVLLKHPTLSFDSLKKFSFAISLTRRLFICMLFSLRVWGDFCYISVIDCWLDSIMVREHNLCDFSSFKFNICLGDQDMFCLNIPSVQFSRWVMSDPATPWTAAHQASLFQHQLPEPAQRIPWAHGKKCVLWLFSSVP